MRFEVLRSAGIGLWPSPKAAHSAQSSWCLGHGAAVRHECEAADDSLFEQEALEARAESLQASIAEV
jgi:hypothetical protein